MYRDSLEAQRARADSEEKRANVAERKLKEMKKKKEKKKVPNPWYKDFWSMFVLSLIVLFITMFVYLFVYLYTSSNERTARYNREESCRKQICKDLCDSEKSIGVKMNRISSSVIKCICYHNESAKGYHMIDTCKEKKNGS